MPDLTEEQKSELPKNVITRALGMQDQVVVDLQHDDPHNGDVYVLCSDGLSGMVTDEEIQRIITASADIREACRKLIQRANERGGEDNITAVLIAIEEADAELIVPPKATADAAERAGSSGAAATEASGADEPTVPGIPDAAGIPRPPGAPPHSDGEAGKA